MAMVALLFVVGCGSGANHTGADGGSGGRDDGDGAGLGGRGGAPAGGASGSGGSAGAGLGGIAGGTGGRGGSGGHNAVGGASGAGGLPACVAMNDDRAPFLDYQRTSAAAAPAMGGPISGGTYFLTNVTYHGGTQVPTPCTLSQIHEVLRFNATSDTTGTMSSTLVFQYSDGSGRSQHVIETSYTATGTTLTGRYTCWQPYDYSETYTATANQILFIRGPLDTSCDNQVVLVLTYDKQP
jgi:hypothetical protein